MSTGWLPVTRPAPVQDGGGWADDSLPSARMWLLALIAGLASLAAALIAIRMTPEALGVPFGRDDAVPGYSFASNMIRFGWFTWNPDVGYPFGSDTALFPAPEIRMWAVLKALTILTSDPITSLNAFFLLGFVAVGSASYLLFFATMRSETLAFILAVSVATLPWHFARFPHYLLADYSAIPIGLLLTFLMWTRWWENSPRRLALAVAAAVYIGTGGVYYAFFSLLAIGPVLVWTISSTRSPRRWWADVLVTATIPLTLAASLAAHSSLARSDLVTSSFNRDPWESIAFAGEFHLAFMPWPLAAGDFTSGSAEGDPRYNLLGTFAVLVSLVVLGFLFAASRRRSGLGHYRQLATELTPWISLLTWMMLWWVPGLGLLFAFAVSPNLRSWGRASIVIVYIATVIFGICLSALQARGRLPRLAIYGILVLTLAWQVGQDHRPWLAPWGHEFDRQAKAYAKAISTRLSPGCPVLQVPLMTYPEGFPTPTEEMGAYDHMWPQIYAPGHRWSFGVMRGSAAAEEANRRYPSELAAGSVVRRAREDGFCAVSIDTKGMTANEDAAYARALGQPTAAVGRWRLYELASSTSDSGRPAQP